MDETKRITTEEFDNISSKYRFNRGLMAKDYYLTLILYLIKDIDGIYFKGGTAINKIILNHQRLSEDIDFTVTRDIKEIQTEISKILNNSKFFGKITSDKDVEGFLRMIIHYNLENEKGTLFIDLNKRAHATNKTEIYPIKHFYHPFIPEFSVKTLAIEEIIAEKMAATIGRNKPRDHFDVYQVIKAGLPINLELAKVKCEQSGDKFSILKMFNQAKKLKNRWDEDMTALLSEPISFNEMIKFLAKHFQLKEEKDIEKELRIKKTMRCRNL